MNMVSRYHAGLRYTGYFFKILPIFWYNKKRTYYTNTPPAQAMGGDGYGCD